MPVVKAIQSFVSVTWQPPMPYQSAEHHHTEKPFAMPDLHRGISGDASMKLNLQAHVPRCSQIFLDAIGMCLGEFDI